MTSDSISPSATEPAEASSGTQDVDGTPPKESMFRRGSMVWAGLSLAAIFWVVESLIHRTLFHDPAFEAVPHDVHELWMRSFIVVLFVCFGFYTDAVLRRYRIAHLQQRELERELAASLTKVLSGYLPICAHCKQIRDKDGEWTAVENYVHEHTNADFTHGICPACLKKYYGDGLDED